MNSEHSLQLRALACHAQGTPMSTSNCQAIWQQLTQHQLQVVDTFTAEQRSYLVLGPRPAPLEPLTGRNLEILERTLLGVSRKVISGDCRISTSTLAQVLKQAYMGLGLTCSPGRVPPLMVLFVHAARGVTQADRMQLGGFESDGRPHVVISNDLENPVMLQLTPAERDVISLRVDGSSYADIASKRQTSYRTVANQIAAACHRLGVSGRLDLLHLLASCSSSNDFEPAPRRNVAR